MITGSFEMRSVYEDLLSFYATKSDFDYEWPHVSISQ